MHTIDRAQIAADCRAAADVIDRNGLHQGSYYNTFQNKPAEQCRVCAAGAINIAVHGFPWSPTFHSRNDARSMAAFKAVSEHVKVGSVALWNDEPGRTAEEVTAAFRACADQLEAEDAQ